MQPRSLQILIQPRPPYETPSMNKLNKVMQAPHKKIQSYPNWDNPLFLLPKTFTTFDPTPDFDSSLPP
jgi:hypothetical protein